MIDIDQEIGKYGLSRVTYEQCLEDIKKKVNGQADIDWVEIAEKYNLPLHGDTLRKASQTIFGGAFIREYINELRAAGTQDSKYLEDLKQEKLEIRKEKQKLQDERIEYQRLLREQARRESFIDLLRRTMKKDVKRFIYKPRPAVNDCSKNDMIICLSDIHAGIEVDNYFNTYNTEELETRLTKYLDEIANIQEMHRCQVCHLVLGGDLISGWIHRNLRLQNNENVIEQVKLISTYIGEFIHALTELFDTVKVYSVAGNHSRLSPAKEEHLKGEELDALIPFYLGIKFENCLNVDIVENCIDDTILSFRTRGGFLFYGVHGDKDALSSVVKNLTLVTGTKPDGIIIGHRHHNGLTSEHGVKVVQCGSVVGMDDFCVDHRISGKPEQCVIVTDDKSPVKCYYDVSLV